MIDLTSQELALVQAGLRAHIPGAKVWVFGSRAKGTARRGSDLDLALDASTALPPALKAQLAETLEEARLPFRVDLVDLHTISPQFRALIDAHKIALPGFEN